MEKFEIGDIVKCIDVKFPSTFHYTPPLKLNREYIVQGLLTCKCGKNGIDVGLVSPMRVTVCFSCGHKIASSDIWWSASHRFVKRQSVKNRVEQAVEEENYELAHELTYGMV